MYNRIINAPTSVSATMTCTAIGPCRRALAAEGDEWVNLHRNLAGREEKRGARRHHNGTSEISVQGRFRAWLAAMMPDEGAPR